MDINSIFKAGSKVDVLLRVDSAQQVGVYSLAAHEPYTLLKDLSITFNYRQQTADAEKQGFLISHAEDYPYSVSLYNVPFTEKISNLVFKQGESGAMKTHMMRCLAADHKIYFEHNQCFNMYVYHNNVLIGHFAETDNYLEGPELENDESYIVFYNYIPSEGSIVYELETPYHAYFTLEIFGEGNVGDQTSSVYLKFSQCALVTNKQFYFNSNDGSNTVNLTFNIIKGNKDVLIIE